MTCHIGAENLYFSRIKNEEFKEFCCKGHPVTDNLFGDDLGKVVEDILKGNKVGSKISGTFH